jgi:F-type H+-transporting ATPase subunit alpha
VPVKKVREFENTYLDLLDTHHREVLNNLKAGKLLDDDLKIMEQAARDVAAQYVVQTA